MVPGVAIHWLSKERSSARRSSGGALALYEEMASIACAMATISVASLRVDRVSCSEMTPAW
jgi:hypothetical protein